MISQVYDAQITDILNGGKIYRLRNKHYNANLAMGSVLAQRFQASTALTPSFTVHMVGQPECCEGDHAPCNPSTTPPSPSTMLPPTSSPVPECPTTEIVDEWPGNFKGEFAIPIWNPVTGGWRVELQFSEPVSNLQVTSFCTVV